MAIKFNLLVDEVIESANNTGYIFCNIALSIQVSRLVKN